MFTKYSMFTKYFLDIFFRRVIIVAKNIFSLII